MEELKSIKSSVQTGISKNEWGTLTVIKYPQNISPRFSQVARNGQTIFAVHFYEEGGTYKVVYILVNADGEIADILHETAGIQPTLFFSPAGDLWVSVSPYYSDKDVEITIPFRNRTDFPEPKTNRPFAGKYAGTTDTSALFHDENIWADSKPDKLLRIDFKDGKLKAKKNFKIPAPNRNYIIIDGNIAHLFALEWEGNSLLYRILDSDSNVVSQQRIRTVNDDYSQFKVLKVSDHKLNYFALGDEFAYIGSLTFGGVKSEEKFPTTIDEMHNLFNPVRINDHTFAVTFNWEEGSGWAIIQNDRLKNFFVERENGYRCLVTDETLPLPNDLVISAISTPDENTYCAVFYPNTEKKEEIYILNKSVL